VVIKKPKINWMNGPLRQPFVAYVRRNCWESCFTCRHRTVTSLFPIFDLTKLCQSNAYHYSSYPLQITGDGINYVGMLFFLHFRTPCRSLLVSQKGACHASYFFETMDDLLTVQHSICRGSTALHCLFARVSGCDGSKVPKTRRHQVSSRRVIFEMCYTVYPN
jgi:hypothetical protein